MNASLSKIEAQPCVQRIPAAEVERFIQEREAEARDRAAAEDLLSRARAEAKEELDRVKRESDALEERLEAEAETLAERSAAKFKAKQEAILATTALAQVAAIAKDYAALETWLTETVMAAVGAILKDVTPGERWAGLIQSCLDKTSQRWNLTVLCHPDDFEALTEVLAAEPFKSEISHLVRDATISPGVCYLKSDADFFEIDVEAQVNAIRAQIETSLAAATDPEPDSDHEVPE
jgi:type III secretion protein L